MNRIAVLAVCIVILTPCVMVAILGPWPIKIVAIAAIVAFLAITFRPEMDK